MLETPSDLDRLKQQVLRFAANLRPHHIALVALLTAVGVGVVAARTMALPGPRPVLEGERLQIQVVTRVEPDVAPGSVMEVGNLVEGFEYRRPAPAMIENTDYSTHEEEFEAPAARPARRHGEDHATASAPPQPEAGPERRREARVGRWFGFDAPERDYRAEREARRARIDARMERDREQREVRWSRSDGEPAGDDGRDGRRRQDEDPADLRG